MFSDFPLFFLSTDPWGLKKYVFFFSARVVLLFLRIYEKNFNMLYSCVAHKKCMKKKRRQKGTTAFVAHIRFDNVETTYYYLIVYKSMLRILYYNKTKKSINTFFISQYIRNNLWH